MACSNLKLEQAIIPKTYYLSPITYFSFSGSNFPSPNGLLLRSIGALLP